MPYVQVNLGAGRSREVKRRVVKALTDALVESAGVKREFVVVHIFDMPYENIGREGELFVDKYPELSGEPRPSDEGR